MFPESSKLRGAAPLRLPFSHALVISQGMSSDTDAPDAARLRKALAAGDPSEVKSLINGGANLHYRFENGYDALIDAVHGRDVFFDDRLLDLLRLLIGHQVDLNGISSYGESGLRVLSRLGRFDAVHLLLEAGAEEAQLQWTPLIRAVAIGTLDDIRSLLDAGAPLEGRDWWSRTAWLVALQTGDLAKAALLAERGANLEAVGRCGKPPLFYPIECHRTAMLRWLLELGFDVECTDEFGTTALIQAAEAGFEPGVELLLGAGAQIDREHNGGTALSEARTRTLAVRLLEAGANPRFLGNEGRRAIVGLPAEPDIGLLAGVKPAEFHRARTRRFGTANPERMEEPFWIGMIRSGVSGYAATTHFKGPSSMTEEEPVWCAQRFGQSLTVLPDGRAVQIGGEHEDSYDPDFCIYNDVFVHETDGTVRILGYPEAVFPPTDFHTATLIGDAIYIVGSLGYGGRRDYGRTPVYRLDTRTWQIDRLEASGPGPGWIHGHRVTRIGDEGILVTGGEVLTREGNEEQATNNHQGFLLNTASLVWAEREAGNQGGG